MTQNGATPQCLLLVRSTLEMAAMMKRVYPLFEPSLCEIEAEVLMAGQSLLNAGSEPRARLALEAIHRARGKMGELDQSQNRFQA